MPAKYASNKPAFKFWFSIYGFTAFILTIAVVVFAWLASESRKEAGEGRTASGPPIRSGRVPEEQLQSLSHFEAPAFSATSWSKAPVQFTRAMARYKDRNYASAIDDLRALTLAQPSFDEARFYLGICLLLTNRTPAAIQELRTVAASKQPSPWVEQARFYLAKALLGEGDRSGAEQQLDVVIALQGELEKPARDLLAQIQ